MRPLHVAFATSIAAVIVTSWPAYSAPAAAVMTPKQAALKGLTVTRNAREQRVDKLIVGLKDTAVAARAETLSADRVQSLGRSAGITLKALRPLEGRARLMQLDRSMTVSEARAVAARLAQDPTVEFAEPNVRFHVLAVPNEVRYAQWQWNLFAPTSSYTGAAGASSVTATAVGGGNLPPAWDVSSGKDVVVAIVDTGIVNHTDLNGTAAGAPYVASGRFLPGYDFVSSNNGSMAPANFVANDGDGRDADPSDPGDWITVQEKTLYPDDCTDATETPPYSPSDSTWHGSHIAGILAATANNSVGIAGIGWNVKIVPVRALGKCGGDLNDIADAIRWAAGLPVSGVPANSNKASVISLSLGGDDTCSTYMQNAVDAATASGATIVAAAGNGGSIGLIAPAICNGVIAVTAHTINGENADYANVASTVSPKAEMLSAAGGGTPTTLGSLLYEKLLYVTMASSKRREHIKTPQQQAAYDEIQTVRLFPRQIHPDSHCQSGPVQRLRADNQHSIIVNETDLSVMTPVANWRYNRQPRAQQQRNRRDEMKFFQASKFKTKILFIIGIMLVGIAALIALSLFSLKREMVEDRKIKTRHVVETAFGILEHFNDQIKQGAMTPEKAQAAAIALIKKCALRRKGLLLDQRYASHDDHAPIQSRARRPGPHRLQGPGRQASFCGLRGHGEGKQGGVRGLPLAEAELQGPGSQNILR